MQLAVMNPADWDHELVAHAASERTRLCKGEVMRIRRHAAADKAGLPQNEFPVALIAQPNRFAQNTNGAAARPFPGVGCNLLVATSVGLACRHRGLVRDSMRRLRR
jgi:hypothetical protein